MAKYSNPPKSLKDLTKQQAYVLEKGLEEVWRYDIFGSGVNRKLDEPYTTFDGQFHWSSNKDFFVYITDLTGTSDVRSASNVLYQTMTAAPEFSKPTMTGAPEYAAPSNTLNPEQLKQFQEEGEAKSAKLKATQVEAKEAVETAIKKQQQFYAQEAERAKQVGETLKKGRIYYKVEGKEIVKTEKVENLRQQARANPQATLEIIEKTIKDRLPTIPDLAATQTSLDIVQNLQTDSAPQVNTAVLSTLASNPKQIDGVITSNPNTDNLKIWLQTLSDEHLTSQEISQTVTRAAFGDLFQKEVLPDFTIGLSKTPGEGFQEFGLDQVSTEYSSLMSRQESFLGGLKDFSVDGVRSQISSKVKSFLTERIQNLSEDSALRGFFNSETVKVLLPVAGVGVPAAWEAIGGSFFGKMAVSSGFAPVLGWLGEKTGINFGIKKVAQIATEKGIESATGVGLAATITTAFAWTGPLAPVIGTVGAFLIEVVGAKIINKATGWIKSAASKIKENLIPISGGLIAVGFLIFPQGSIVGTGLIVAGGTGMVGGVLGGGLPSLSKSLTGIASGTGNLLGALGGAFLGAVGMPILVTLLVFPVVVVLILFIINSGAYVVPPGVGTGSSSCTREAAEKPIATDVIYSSDGKYAFPVANAHNIGLSCTHWDKSLATDIFTGHLRGDQFPVLAYTSGVIEGISLDDSKGGKYIILRGSDGRYYYYAHNCTLYVKEGDSVKVGDVMATTDNSGSAAKTAEHLHFAISSFPNFFQGGSVCPSKDFEEKFNLGRCDASNECIP